MGIIGDDLLHRIARAEHEDNWDLVVELLALAQLNATKNYVRLVREMCKGTISKVSKND